MRGAQRPDITQAKVLLFTRHAACAAEIERALATLRPALHVVESLEDAARDCGTERPELILVDSAFPDAADAEDAGDPDPGSAECALLVLLRGIAGCEVLEGCEIVIWAEDLPRHGLAADAHIPDSALWLPSRLGPDALRGCVLRIVSRVRSQAALRAELQAARAELAPESEERKQSGHEDAPRRASPEPAEREVKTRFLAAMSHELRTPLNAIIGFSELLQQELFGTLNPRQKQHVGNVLSSGRQLLKLVNDTLELARIEGGQPALRRSWIAPQQLIAPSLDAAQELAARQGVLLTSAIGEEVPELYLDAERMRQVIARLLTGAIERTPPGRAVALRLVAEEGRLLISVQDGRGARPEPAEPRGPVWPPDPAAAAEPRVGLDLALAERLVEMHGGQLAAQATPGEGARYTVSLPLLGRGAAGPSGGAAGSRDLSRVLLVEDDAAAGQAIEAQLGRLGLSVAIAKTAAEGVRLAGELRPGTLLLDLILPDADGWAVLGHLRSDPRTSAVDVIVTSVMDAPERSDQLGVSAYLVKPVRPSSLLATLSARGMRICSIEGLRVVVIGLTGTPGAHLYPIIEHLRCAGCEVEPVEPTARALPKPRGGWSADLIVIDATTRAPRERGEALLRHLGLDGVPCLWLCDEAPQGTASAASGVHAERWQPSLALASARVLPELVRAVHSARSRAAKEHGR